MNRVACISLDTRPKLRILKGYALNTKFLAAVGILRRKKHMKAETILNVLKIGFLVQKIRF